MSDRRERGDTIVEVLIAIAVASGLLIITYATMNRNSLLSRANQERIEATRIAQGQIEALNRLSTDNPSVLPATPNASFCLLASGVQSTTTPTVNIENDNFANYGTCRRDFYSYAIVRQSAKNYRVYVRWERIGGGPRNEIIMAYRTEN